MLEGSGKFLNYPSKTGKRQYDKFFIYVPTEVAKDISFPFKAGEQVQIKINTDGRKLIVERGGKNKK